VRYELRDPLPTEIPGTQAAADVFLRPGSASQSFEIPRELRGGIWIAPYPELRLELDASWQSWSSLDQTDIVLDRDVFRDGPVVSTPRDWDDTISLRLGLEGDITERVMMYGGVAFEPTPVPDGTVEPGFPRGDAWVYGFGASYSFPDISFDVGYSRHEHEGRGAPRQEPNPAIAGRYVATDQVWGFSVRWRK
jgi:long-subunit fatty acid transport protein